MVRDNDLRDFLSGLSEKRLREHLKLYIQNGMTDRAGLAQAELDSR